MPAALRPTGPLGRHRGTIIAAATIATVAIVGLKQHAATLRNKELSQDPQTPNFYVSVDRSGGGV